MVKLKISGDISIVNLALCLIVVDLMLVLLKDYLSSNPLMNKKGSALRGRHESGLVKEIALNHKGMRPSLLTSWSCLFLPHQCIGNLKYF